MTAFEYVALNEHGSAKKGIIEGDSSRHVRQLLRERGLTPVEVTVTRANIQASNWLQWWRRIPPMELALITRQVATMIGAGLAIEEAIQAVAQQSSSRKATSVLMTVRGNVMQGQSLSAALGEFPQTFSPMFRATVFCMTCCKRINRSVCVRSDGCFSPSFEGGTLLRHRGEGRLA